MSDSRCRLALKYRLMFYVGGAIFAAASYILGLCAFGAESASWGQADVHQKLIGNLTSAFQSHQLTFFAWELICIGLFVTMGILFDREVYYRRRAEARANVDGLTGIYNHRYLQERLAEEVERSSRYDHGFSVILFDIDNFKAYNDTHGHHEGDKLLKMFADLCGQCIRSIDILARYGGEEFMVILPEAGVEEAAAVAERIRLVTGRETTTAFGKGKGATVSGGIAGYPQHGTTRRDLIVNADAALYSAKRAGRNRCLVYDPTSHEPYRDASGHIQSLPHPEDRCDDARTERPAPRPLDKDQSKAA